MNIEQKFFTKMAYCWEYFEKDGLTDILIDKYINSIVNPVLVVGSGQGLVSSYLIKLGFNVSSIDSVLEMATLAKERRNVDTEIIDILDFKSNYNFNTIIVNTGVASPSFVDNFSKQLAISLNNNLKVGGKVVLASFERTHYDDFAHRLFLDKSHSLIKYLCTEIYSGNNIINALRNSEVAHNFTKYCSIRYKKELMEYEYQIKNAMLAYYNQNPNQPLNDNFYSYLCHIPYGLSDLQQTYLMDNMFLEGLIVQSVDKHDSVIIAILKKEK